MARFAGRHPGVRFGSTMTVLDSGPSATIESALQQIDRAMRFHELEMAWVDGLRRHRLDEDRDRILARAGARLCVLDDTDDQWLRLCWLRMVADEFRRRGEQPLSDDLVGIVRSELREAFAHAEPDLDCLSSSLSAGVDLATITERFPRPAMTVRDLGRTAQQLQGSDLMALVPKEHVELATSVAEGLLPPRYLVAVVPDPWRITRDDLIRWSGPLEARGELPRLARRLVAETTEADRIDFPAGTGVSNPGFDGIVECDRGNQFVPTGLSGWELSVAKSDPNRKARDDYTNRAAEASMEAASETAYVALICANWKARQFEEEKSKEGHFRFVRALNVDDLEAWLECAPSTTIWLREQMVHPVTGCKSLSSWWQQWLKSTKIPLESEIVLAGRSDQADTLRDRCSQQGGGFVTIGGSVHRDEILAFVSAALCTGEPERVGADVLYVDDHDAAQRLLGSATPPGSTAPNTRQALTIVVPSNDFARHLPPGTNHRMIVPIPGSPQADIELKAVDSDIVAQRLRDAGRDIHSAHHLGGVARMSLLALRRHLAVSPELHRPRWATGPIDSTLRRGLLLGGWDESRKGDKQIVKEFVGQGYESVTDKLRQLDPGDAPMTATGDQWHSVAPEDTWTLLAHHLTRTDVKTFSEVANRVLTEPDPFHGLTGDELLLARFEGTRTRYSPSLKRAIATTLALFGNQPPVLQGTTTPDSGIASDVVATVLRSANKDATTKTWAVVVESLPLLAEAAPEAVLGALRTCLSEPHAFAGSIFTDSELDGLDRLPSPHLQILNALEIMAWSPEHLTAVVDMLARLAEIDPGGRYSNRPDNSLAAIMCTWLPSTTAGADERLNAVRMLRTSHNKVAWPLMLSMLPNERNFAEHKPGPRFRDWSEQRNGTTQSDQSLTVASVLEMLLEDVGSDPGRWVDLIPEIPSLPADLRTSMIEALDRVAASGPEEAFRSEVFPKLQDFLNLNREHSDTNWGLPDSELAVLDDVLGHLRPAETAVAHRHLFSGNLMYIDGVQATDGWDTFQDALKAKHAEAVEEIFADGGLSTVLAFAESVEQPHGVGSALSRCSPTLDIDILGAMDTAQEVVTQFALGYFSHRFTEIGWDGFDRLITEHDLPPQVAADLFRAPPPMESPWTRVDGLGNEVAGHYWARAGLSDLGHPKELGQLLEVSRRLREAGRVELALKMLAVRHETHKAQPDFAEEAAACLEQWLQNPTEPDQTQWTPSRLAKLFEVLDEHRESLGRRRVATLEWQYYPILHNHSGFKAPNLYREMAADPDFFVQLVELAFRPASKSAGSPSEPTETERQLALNAHRVLRCWPDSHFVTGLDDAGRIEARALDQWIDDARERLAKTDRTDIGDVMIGTALVSTPADANGEWPAVPVRNLLERLQNDQIESGLRCAVINQRGVTCRSPGDGGDQERDLAARYRNLSHRFAQWPRTAAVLEGLAKSYERESGIDDRDAEAHRRGLPYR